MTSHLFALRAAALSVLIRLALAAPFFETGPHNTTIYYLSRITPTIFGQPASDYDFILAGYHTGIHSAVQYFAAHVERGRQSNDTASMTAFLNALGTGSITTEQRSNTTWLCSQLPQDMVPFLPSCHDVEQVRNIDSDSDTEKRSLYTWSRHAAHVASQASVQAMQSYFAFTTDYTLPDSPRSMCHVGSDNVKACTSWSTPEQGLLSLHDIAKAAQDALTYENYAISFDMYSAQANFVILTMEAESNKACAAGKGSRSKRTPTCPMTDVCISNRPNGCT